MGGPAITAQAIERRTSLWRAMAPLLALLCAAPARAAEPWPALQPGGRPALQALTASLEQRGRAIATWVGLEREGCEASRVKGKPCGAGLLDALTRLLAVVNALDELQRQVTARLAEQPAAQLDADRRACAADKDAPACARLRADDAALDGFGQLRVAPALESLGRLAEEAARDLQLAKAMHTSQTGKLPAPPAAKPRDPRLDEDIRLQADGKEGAPPPPPPQRLLAQCRAGQGEVCMTVAGIYEARREGRKAREFYRAACKRGVKAGCAQAEARGKADK